MLAKALRDRELEIRYTSFEIALVFDENGNVVLKKIGDAKKIVFDENEQQLMQGKVFTHNHPSGMSFSIDDVLFLVWQELAEIRVVSSNYRYAMSLAVPVENKVDFLLKIKRAVSPIAARIAARLNEDVVAGRIKGMRTKSSGMKYGWR